MLLQITPLCLLCLVTSIAAHGWNNVSRSQFESIVHENDIVLVAFVAKSTESSKILEPEWSLAAAQTKQSLITIDCAIEIELCAENEVISLPAIRLYKSNRGQDRYRGPRKASAIIQYVRRSTRPTISTLDSINISDFKSIDEYVVVAYLNPEDNESKSTFERLAAGSHHKFSFGMTTDVRLANAENVPIPSIVCYKTSDGEQEIFSGEWRLRTMESFIEASTAPLIGELTRRNEMKYLQVGKSLIYIFAVTPSERSHYQSLLMPLAKMYREYINFVTVDAVEYAHMAPGLGLDAGNFPALALQNPMFGQVFPFEARKQIIVKEVEGWVLNIVAGRVLPWNGMSGRDGSKGLMKDEL